MNTNLDALREDHVTISRILEKRRAVTVETLPVGVRIVWDIYLLILQDGLKTIESLINYSASLPSEHEHISE